mmetsp:Transcript_117060/g.303580  ORF Transcript_117060/g.303580 Transcript_117060/m.303580 type:complete len:420 (+) Transcript_117060:82-1341(+)
MVPQPCSQMVSCMLLLLALLSCVRDCECGCDSSEEGLLSLMQLYLGPAERDFGTRETAQAADDEILPYGRTVLSTNPRETVEWMATYYSNVIRLPELEVCDGIERAAVLLDLGLNQTQLMIFVKPAAQFGHDLDPGITISRIEKSVAEVFAGRATYTSWFDSHDGFRVNHFDPIRAFADGHEVGVFDHNFERGPETSQHYVMFFLPHTMYAIQNGGSNIGVDQDDGLPEFLITGCRDGERGDRKLGGGGSTQVYWKATFRANNPGTALDFVVKVLNAAVIGCPYSWPANEGCTGGVWTELPISKFQLHFVNSPQYQAREDTIKNFTDRVLSRRDLKAGLLDPYMYNSLILSVKSLDPYIERLRAHGYDFLLADVSRGQHALIVCIPDNDITFQLRSAHINSDTRATTLSNTCPQRFSDY